MLSIGEVNLVDTLIETVAYVVEYFGARRRLYRYRWLGGAWRQEGPFFERSRGGRVDLPSVVTDISGVYEGLAVAGLKRIVVEDGATVKGEWSRVCFFL